MQKVPSYITSELAKEIAMALLEAAEMAELISSPVCLIETRRTVVASSNLPEVDSDRYVIVPVDYDELSMTVWEAMAQKASIKEP